MINEDDIIAYDLPLLQQRIKAEAAAQGRELKDLSDEELNKRAEEMGGDASNYQSAYTLGRRADGTPGFDINKPKQKTLAQLVRGNQEPPPAFFAGIPEAMQQALAGINQQRIDNEVPTRNNYSDIDRKPSTGIEDSAPNVSIPTKTNRGTVVPPFRAESTVRGLLSKELKGLEIDPVYSQTTKTGSGTVGSGEGTGARGLIPNVDREMEELRTQQENRRQTREERESSVATGEAMLGSPVDYLDPKRPSQGASSSYIKSQKTDAQRLEKELDTQKREEALKARESSVVAGEAMLGSPVDYLDPKSPSMDDASIRAQKTDAQRLQKKIDSTPDETELRKKERELKERNVRIADVITQNVQAIGRENTPKERATVLNNLAISVYDAEFPNVPIDENLEEFRAIQEYTYSGVYEEIFKKQGLETNQVGIIIDPNTKLFTAVSEPKDLRNITKQLEGTPPAYKPGDQIPNVAPIQPVTLESYRKAVVSDNPEDLRNITKQLEGTPPPYEPGSQIANVAPIQPVTLESYKKATAPVLEFEKNTISYIEGLEKFSATPYPDGKLPDGSQRYSIGYGTISEKGAKRISKQEASQRMKTYLQAEVYPEIDFIQENGTYNLNADQMTALSSLIYNVGSPAWRTSKARKALLEGNLEVFIEQAFSGPTAFGTGSEQGFLKGLQKRRKREQALFEDGSSAIPVG